MLFSRVLLFASSVLLFSGCAKSPYEDGARIYKAYCANCHMDTGEGLGALIPPVNGVAYITQNHDRLPCLVRYGLQDSIVVNGKSYAEQMPPADKLSDIDITNVLNYLNTHLGNRNPLFTLEGVRARLEKCKR